MLRAAPVQRDTDWSSVAETAEAAAGFYNGSVAEKAAELSRGGSVSDKTYTATAVALPSVADTAVTATAVPLVSVAESAETATAFSRWSVSAETAAADAGKAFRRHDRAADVVLVLRGKLVERLAHGGG